VRWLINAGQGMFDSEARICQNDECKKEFIAKVYNTIYCSPECRKVVTNKKLLENYYRKKDNKKRKRVCITDNCNTVLSSYNEEDICEQCKNERYIQRLVGWGWDENKLREEQR
jgi:hypothetical protein